MDPGEALTATMEAAIGLAGFSGIVVVLGRRSQGEWRPQEELRLTNLLVGSLTAFLVSLLGVLLLSSPLSHTTVWSLCSVAWLVAVGWHSGWIVVRSRALGDEGLRHVSPAFYWLGFTSTLALLALQIVNVVTLRALWPLLAGLFLSLALCTRQFVMLLRSSRT
jgi:hypothetical protein